MTEPSAIVGRPRVLFVFSIFHYYREMLPVAEYYRWQGYEVHVLIGYSGATAQEASQRCHSAGFYVSHAPPELRYGDHLADHNGDRNRCGSEDRRKGSLIGSARMFLGLVRRNIWTRRYTERLISEIVPDLIFGGPFHSCGALDDGIARACWRRRIPFCCLPVSPYLGERNSIEARFSNLASGMLSSDLEVDHSPLNRLVAWLFPGWTRKRNGKTIFMFNPLTMVATNMIGLLPQNPWQKPSELYDVVFVDSEFSRDMLVEGRYDPNKVAVVGSPLLDGVFKNLGNDEYAAELYRSLGLRSWTPFVLYNVEPSAEHRYSSWDDHWRRFTDMMNALRSTNVPVVLSLHPLCDPSRYRFVEDSYGFRIAQQYKIAELYPYCAVSVSFPCSTNMLSLVFQKPLVIYDFFGHTRPGGPREKLFRQPGALCAYEAREVAKFVSDVMQGSEDIKHLAPAVNPRQSACENIRHHVRERFGV